MKRGQAALEFIMTYGWAILAVLAAIAALAYFGVLNPGKYVPDKCLFKTGITCTDFLITETSGTEVTVQFTMQNDMGEAITIDAVSDVQAEIKNNGPEDCTPTGSSTIGAGESEEFTCTGVAGNPGVDQPVKVKITFDYRKTAGTYTQKAPGEISTTVQ
ncbi:MAG: hypothetical protein OXR66_05830 [Candidatus Woesearchaeota archaeon]|nr:hypothetical protein [Candidatus Woesearchaeota archaeon]